MGPIVGHPIVIIKTILKRERNTKRIPFLFTHKKTAANQNGGELFLAELGFLIIIYVITDITEQEINDSE